MLKSAFLHLKSANFAILLFLSILTVSLRIIFLIKLVIILMMSAKWWFLKVKVFWNKDYDVRIPIHDVTNKILSRGSTYIIDVVMWPKLGNSSTSMKEVIITSILQGIDQKNHIFKKWSWFKFNNLGVAQGMALKLYTSVAKRLKLQFRKFLGLILTFVEVTGEKLVGGPLCPLPSWIGLRTYFSTINVSIYYCRILNIQELIVMGKFS